MAMSAIYERQSGSVEEYTRQFRPIEGQVGTVFLHKMFSNRKNFIWMARWSISPFLTGLKMSRRDKGFPGWGAFQTGGEAVRNSAADWRRRGKTGSP